MPSACATGQSACLDCPVPPPPPYPQPYAELHRPWCPRDPVARTARDHTSRPVPCPCAPRTTLSRPALRPAVPAPLGTVRPCARPFLHRSEPSGPAPGRSRTSAVAWDRPAQHPAVPTPLPIPHSVVGQCYSCVAEHRLLVPGTQLQFPVNENISPPPPPPPTPGGGGGGGGGASPGLSFGSFGGGRDWCCLCTPLPSPFLYSALLFAFTNIPRPTRLRFLLKNLRQQASPSSACWAFRTLSATRSPVPWPDARSLAYAARLVARLHARAKVYFDDDIVLVANSPSMPPRIHSRPRGTPTSGRRVCGTSPSAAAPHPAPRWTPWQS